MKAIVQDRYGPPRDVLRLVDMGKPAVADGEVLVRVHAAAVNPADWHVMRGDPYIARLSFGLRRPKAAIPGCDLAGVVEAAGGDVTSLRPGDEVFGSTFMRGFGAFAEYASVSADLLSEKPQSRKSTGRETLLAGGQGSWCSSMASASCGPSSSSTGS